MRAQMPSAWISNISKQDYFTRRLEVCFSLLSVHCPGGVGLPETVFLIIIVSLSSGMPTPIQDYLSSVWIVPSMVCVHLLGLVEHQESIGGELFSLTSEKQWEMPWLHGLQQDCKRVPYLMLLLGPDWVWGNTVITCACQSQPRFVGVSHHLCLPALAREQ